MNIKKLTKEEQKKKLKDAKEHLERLNNSIRFGIKIDEELKKEVISTIESLEGVVNKNDDEEISDGEDDEADEEADDNEENDDEEEEADEEADAINELVVTTDALEVNEEEEEEGDITVDSIAAGNTPLIPLKIEIQDSSLHNRTLLEIYPKNTVRALLSSGFLQETWSSNYQANLAKNHYENELDQLDS